VVAGTENDSHARSRSLGGRTLVEGRAPTGAGTATEGFPRANFALRAAVIGESRGA
jgi:hypothetical protein